MAKRPIFIPAPNTLELVSTVMLALPWHPGFALTQKKKNIQALHCAAAACGYAPLLEISTKADEILGRHLSAFHLSVGSSQGAMRLEAAFQGSKIFELGGPYNDLYFAEPRAAKRDPRLRNSGAVVGFEFEGIRFPTEPKTAFYDWLYIRAIFEHRDWLRPRLQKYAAFSDIEFNPERSLNCQARSCALFVALMMRDSLNQSILEPESFLRFIAERSTASQQTDRLFG